MVVELNRNVHLLVVKMANQLHNMHTVCYLRQDKQQKVPCRTNTLFAPLNHRLGMDMVKRELEDLAFATLHPKTYNKIVCLVADRAPARRQFLERITSDVKRDLQHEQLKATVSSRSKHYYSIYRKMLVGQRQFSEIYDLVGVRILVDSVADCYTALSMVHARWKPIPTRLKDYISVPKFNMYQSLHTTVIGPQGIPFELQIRTQAMHRWSECGAAAHWKYKREVDA